MLGRAKKVMIDKENTTIVGGAGKKADIQARMTRPRSCGPHCRTPPPSRGLLITTEAMVAEVPKKQSPAMPGGPGGGMGGMDF
jgi:hypothetical protein